MDINGWRIDTSRPSEELFFWSDSTHFANEKRGILCEQVVTSYASLTDGNKTELQDTTKEVIKKLNNENLHYYQPTLQLVVIVARVSEYNVISSILPIVLINLLVFPVFFMNRAKLRNRLQYIVTLYLALAASTFFLEKPKSNKALLPDLLGLLACVMLTLAGLESVIVYYMSKRPTL